MIAGTGILLRHFLRRGWLAIGAWSVALTLLYYSQAVGVDGLYETQAEFDAAAAAMEHNAAFIAMAGPARALNTIGGQVTWQSTAFGAILIGLMVMFMLGRHTRVEEETGREELLRAAPIGPFATLTAGVLVCLIASAVAGVLTALSLISYPLAAADSWGLGIGLMLCGWFFTAVAALAAQLTSSPRGMYGVTGIVIGVSYVLRALGDVGDSALSWLSPIGWYQGMHAFSGLRWWPALLLAGGFVVCLAAAYAVCTRRDYGGGVFAARPGPASASPALTTWPGLAWRLQRPAVIGWALGMLFGGFAYGSMGSDVGDLLGEGAAADVFAAADGSLLDGFYASAVLILAMCCCGFAISSALRPRNEEDGRRIESLLATGQRRSVWLLGHVAITVAGTVLLLVLASIGLGLGYAWSTDQLGDAGVVFGYVPAALPYAVPVLLLSAVARLLHGVAPRLASLAWLGLVIALVAMIFGPLLNLPDWFVDLSPFSHLALMPAEDFRWRPVAVLGGIALALSVLGQLAFSRRDVRT